MKIPALLTAVLTLTCLGGPADAQEQSAPRAWSPQGMSFNPTFTARAAPSEARPSQIDDARSRYAERSHDASEIPVMARSDFGPRNPTSAGAALRRTQILNQGVADVRRDAWRATRDNHTEEEPPMAKLRTPRPALEFADRTNLGGSKLRTEEGRALRPVANPFSKKVEPGPAMQRALSGHGTKFKKRSGKVRVDLHAARQQGQ